MENTKSIFRTSPYKAKAKEILDKMTLTEKVGQLVLLGSMNQLDPDDMRAGKIGSLLNVPDVKTANSLQKMAVEETRLGIPLLIGHDVVHGDRTLFPVPLGGSASFDLERIEKAESVAAMEAYHEGINWIYSPMIDIARDARWGRMAEGAGEDKFYGSKVAAARVRGFQTVNPETGKPYTAACFKHYCGYGLSEAGRDYESCDIGERTLYGEYLPVYKAALEAGSMTCMCSFNTLNGVPVTGSRYYLTELLREKWGFEGAVVSDWQSVSELKYHRVAGDEKECAALAINAGCDIDMHSGVYSAELEALALEDENVMAAVDRAVMRVLIVKIALGLFDDPYRDEDNTKYFLTEESRQASRDLAVNSMVLLKNEENTLPIKRDGKKWLLTGPFADARFENMGIWGGRGDPKTITTIKDALEKDGGIVIEYLKGCEFEGNDRSKMKNAARLAASCDGIIYVCGEPCQWAGENGGRVDLSLGALQSEYLKLLSSLRKPLVTVVLASRPLAIENVDRASKAVLLGWQGGVELGSAVCDLLLGDHSPSGRLPVTFPRHTGQLPFYYANLSGGRPRWRTDVLSRYKDCETTPLYPYGYGLTYGNVTYSEIKLDKKTFKTDETITATVKVKNDSDTPVKEVVQAYFEDLVSSVATPERRLCGFEKVTLGAHEEKEVSFTFKADDFSFIGMNLEPTVEKGEFAIFIGPDSTTGNKEVFELI